MKSGRLRGWRAECSACCLQGCDPGRQAGGRRCVLYDFEEHRGKQRQNRDFRLRCAESGGLSDQGCGPMARLSVPVEKMFNGTATAKGTLIITSKKVIVTTPGTDNKKVL